jgi:hypothetical protein
VRTLAVVIVCRVRDPCPGMIEAEEQALVEKLVPHPAVETYDMRFVIVGSGAIRMHQEREYLGRPSATTLRNPDFASYAGPFGGYRIQDIGLIPDPLPFNGRRLVGQ